MMNSLLGHDEVWREFRGALGSERLHHAWILGGRRGLGKGSFARLAARELVDAGGAAHHPGDNHPDILVLSHLPANDDEEKKRDEGKPHQLRRNITVDQIRRMQQRLTTRPTLGARRAIIIDPADDLEKGAVNALLKSLEEPPAGTHFLLVAHRPGRLLPTIRSRCRTLMFNPLADEQIETILRDQAPQAGPDARRAAIAAAHGSPGAALDFLDRDLAPIEALYRRILTEGDNGLALRGALAETLGSRAGRERLAGALELAGAALAGDLNGSDRERQQRIIAANARIARLAATAPTYNYDPALLMMEIGGLLASAALPREARS